MRDERRHVVSVDVVSDLLAVISVNAVRRALEMTTDQIAEKPVQLDTAVVRSSNAAAP